MSKVCVTKVDLVCQLSLTRKSIFRENKPLKTGFVIMLEPVFDMAHSMHIMSPVNMPLIMQKAQAHTV